MRDAKERDIEKAILHWLTMLPNVFAWKVHTSGIFDPTKKIFRPLQGFSIRGVSDIMGVISPQGKIFAIEVKTPAGLKIHNRQKEQRAIEQRAFIEAIRTYGGVSGIAVSIEDAQEILKGHI